MAEVSRLALGVQETQVDEKSVNKRHVERQHFRINLRIPITIFATTLLSPLIQPVVAQAPGNDVVAWPAGLLLLATVLYAALGTAPDDLWGIDPSVGLFLWTGLPIASVPTMQKVSWVAKAAHFVPSIRTAYGISNFWIRSEEVSEAARVESLERTLKVLHCVIYEGRQGFDENLWSLTPEGLLSPMNQASPALSKEASFIIEKPSARDFLLFAATDYHVFREYEVRIESGGQVVFNTLGMEPSSIIDVDRDMALYIVAAHMVRRPHSQSVLRGLARKEGADEYGPYTLDLDQISRDSKICSIDFHSYANDKWKVRASLDELAGAYYRVVQYIKRTAKLHNPDPDSGVVAHVNVGQTIWIAVFGGALLDVGRLTIQNLPGRWAMRDVSADEAFLTRIEQILKVIEPYANRSSFEDIVYSGGMTRRPAIPFLLAGLFGQILVCYFLAVGTTAGVWTSVALANSLYTGKLTDWHSIYNGKTEKSSESGLKMVVPGTTDLMCIATLDITTPREGILRPGLLLNGVGLIAAIVGAIFQEQTRNALGFNAFQPCKDWVVYAAVGMTVVVAVLVAITTAVQYTKEQTWWNAASLPTRWMIYFSLPPAIIVAALGSLFKAKDWTKLWPVLDAVTWLTGLPLGMLENGRMISVDDNILHLVLVTRWLMAAVASSVGSSSR